jgi:hypothetical protein
MSIIETISSNIQKGFDKANEFLPSSKELEGQFRKAQTLAENITSAKGFGKESRKAHLPAGAKGPIKSSATGSFPKAQEQDWRVRLSIPNVEPFKTESELFQPLIKTNGLVFPFTPAVLISHSASYNALAPTHTNYPFQIYSNSQVDQLVITGDFFVQNGIEAQYWVSALHYLRSCTKMFYGGGGPNQGAPPPVVKLNGYGDYVFNDVPVVIVQFTVDMPQEVDYISTSIGEYTGGVMGPMIPKNTQSTAMGAPGDAKATKSSWAPAQSLFSVTLQPLYSRRAVESFSLEKFVKGGYVGPNTGGFI